MEAYPHNVYSSTLGDSLRAACMIGYHRAEEDLALTWEDVQQIVTIADATLSRWLDEHRSTNFDSDEELLKSYYREVLEKYNKENDKK